MRRAVDVERRLAPAGLVRQTEPVTPASRDARANGERRPRSEPKPQPKREPPARTSQSARELQEALNAFTARHLKDVGPLIVDGVKGHATRERLRSVKYYLGYTGPTQHSATVPPELLRKLRHPRSFGPAQAARGVRRRRDQRKAAKRSAAPRAGVITFDGRPVAAWFEPHLTWARQHGWKGTLQSGWRDPAYWSSCARRSAGHQLAPIAAPGGRRTTSGA